MQDTTNTDRAGWALSALTDFVAETGVDTARDAIADLMQTSSTSHAVVGWIWICCSTKLEN